MGCLLLICFYYLSREAAAVSVEMNQKQVIVVDCGHGGMDPGMIGIDGLKEKDVNLAIGLKVKSALEKKDFQVVMTRETDVGLYDEDSNNKKVQDMQKRIFLIQEVKPVLAVSIHQNSYTQEFYRSFLNFSDNFFWVFLVLFLSYCFNYLRQKKK